jgi:hypothetical protein
VVTPTVEPDRQNQPATLTERAIADMLLEDTGAHMLDSGIVAGRGWQITRAKYGLDGGLPNSSWDGFPKTHEQPEDDDIEPVALQMRAEPEGYIDRWGMVGVSTFHWLVDRLDYDPDLQRRFLIYDRVINADKDKYDKTTWHKSAELFIEALAAKYGASGGIYPGEGSIDNAWTNTYNHESNLDDVIQFALFHMTSDGVLPEGSYVFLEIHRGADVRGGYTKPRLFRAPYEQADLFDFQRMDVWCEGKAEDAVPDGQIDGQVTLEGQVLEPVHYEHSHRWDNSYGDNALRLTYSDGEWLDYHSPDKTEHVLMTSTEEDEVIETVDLYSGGKALADVARLDEETGAWRCPFDGSALRVAGAMSA